VTAPGSAAAESTPRSRGAPRGMPVYLDTPDGFARKAEWVLATMLAALGVPLRVVRDRSEAAACVLAYALAPVPGVPTLPCSGDAIDLIAHSRRLPNNSFRLYHHAESGSGATGPRTGVSGVSDAGGVTGVSDASGVSGKDGVNVSRHAALLGAFPVQADGFAASFDVIASAFVLLAAWDERTSAVRDRYGRLPYDESLFARNTALGPRALVDPPVDAYVALLRDLLTPRLAALRLPPLPHLTWDDLGPAEASDRTGGTRGDGEQGDGEAAACGGRFAVALTHDVDNVKRWTARGLGGALKRAAQAALANDFARARWEAFGLARALAWDMPRGADPYWTFPDLLEREDRAGVTSTFFVIASHGAAIDGARPEVYHERMPRLARLLRRHAREVGLHGNQRDRDDAAALREDRAVLAERVGTTVDGMRYHYLRCLYHETLPLLDGEGFVYDTSLAFGEHEGYRCGFSHPFHPYDLAHDRPLALVELPLAVMDSTLQERHYRALAAPDAREAALAALRPLTRSRGAAALLWHHNRFDPYVGRGYGPVYWDLLDWIRRHGGVATSAIDIVKRWQRRAGETTL